MFDCKSSSFFSASITLCEAPTQSCTLAKHHWSNPSLPPTYPPPIKLGNFLNLHTCPPLRTLISFPSRPSLATLANFRINHCRNRRWNRTTRLPLEQTKTETLWLVSEPRHLRNILTCCFALIEHENSATADDWSILPYNSCNNQARRCVESTLEVNTMIRLTCSASPLNMWRISSSAHCRARVQVGFCSAVFSTIRSCNFSGTKYVLPCSSIIIIHSIFHFLCRPFQETCIIVLWVVKAKSCELLRIQS